MGLTSLSPHIVHIDPVLFIGKSCFTNLNLLELTSTYLNPFQPILTKNSNPFQLQPTLTHFYHFYQHVSIPFKKYSHFFYTLNNFNTKKYHFYPSTQKNTNFYHLQPTSINFNLLHLPIPIYQQNKQALSKDVNCCLCGIAKTIFIFIFLESLKK